MGASFDLHPPAQLNEAGIGAEEVELLPHRWVLFGTAYWPLARSPERLGYPGMEEMPTTLAGQTLWPLTFVFGGRPTAGRRNAGETS